MLESSEQAFHLLFERLRMVASYRINMETNDLESLQRVLDYFRERSELIPVGAAVAIGSTR